METSITFIKLISRASPLIPLVLYLYQKNFKSKIINLIAAFLVISLTSDIISVVLSATKQSNFIVANTYFILQFIFAVVIYYNIYLKKRMAYAAILISLALVGVLLNTVLWQGINTIQSINWMVTSMAIIVMSLGHFLYLNRFPVSHPGQHPYYWISTGFLFYCCFTFTLFIITRVVLQYFKQEAELSFIWMFHNLSNIFKNVCFAIAIWWSAKRDPAWDKPLISEN